MEAKRLNLIVLLSLTLVGCTSVSEYKTVCKQAVPKVSRDSLKLGGVTKDTPVDKALPLVTKALETAVRQVKDYESFVDTCTENPHYINKAAPNVRR